MPTPSRLLGCKSSHPNTYGWKTPYPNTRLTLASPDNCDPQAAPATFAWVTADVSQSGIMGDAPAGTAARGEAWLAASSKGYAQAIARVSALGRKDV